MFEKVLIANRGEIALRIIRALRELGVRSVAVYSTADAGALHVKFADEAVCIGPPQANQSYLNTASIISAAEVTRADAVHPGYGFLSENADFADICKKCHLQWIGPQPELIRLMGDKVRARERMQEAGVPILPGSPAVDNENDLHKVAKEVGYPLIIKASGGGGGRGMKIVRAEEDLVRLWATARTEANNAFSNPDVYVERYCENPRHIEVQVVGDSHGNAIHLGERDCSLQRRHQKILEEAPAFNLPEKVRSELLAAAVRAVKALGYQSVGTLEFLLDTDKRFYFMEMNTRLQVEHPVTEAVTGIDLVREQLRIAAGEKLTVAERKPRGHSIELRINAEHPVTFAPCAGKISALNLPGGMGVRVDTHIYEGYKVPPYYDSLLAKLIVHDNTREEAIQRARRCLDEFVIEGIDTNLAFHRKIIRHPDFRAGRCDTGLVARMIAESSA
jgi:acetyl-CoA carboxylase biotin carboxylase subunit